VTERVSDSLARIESALVEIWAPDESGEARPHATTLNLLAVSGKKEGSTFLDCVNDVASRLGARTFMISVDPRLEPWALDGDVSAVCSVEPGTQKPMACAERVELRMGAMVAKRASSILDALVEASLPSVLLLGPGAHGALVDSLATGADFVLFDGSDTGLTRASELAKLARGSLDDLAFVRIRRWRDMAARFFDAPEHRGATAGIERVSLKHTKREDHAGASAEADLMLAWLGARLGWKTEDGKLLRADGHPLDIQIEALDRPNLLPGALVELELAARLEDQPFLGRAVREEDGEHLSWELHIGDQHHSRRFSTPRRNDAELIERATRNTYGDGLLRETLEFARRWKVK
jgi:glucose-6-phosphate dehydrogenase assembly protein OpcA